MPVSNTKPLTKVKAKVLRALAEQVFLGRGVPQDDAEVVADILIEANLRGHDSHGVIRIPKWVVGLDSGMVTVSYTHLRAHET